ncbi:glycosyltransferase [Methanosarcina barkeri]|uniref:Glycosyl transferase GT4 family n=1 Tax=Methanosarcina barkeri CM1 TaxID=796385 RepID=A0A0G3CL22_METBA|nr:glycosyltransferase [Methanosarcina barkeri]AKJ39837.1 glycosyl transferase GT4 family [Methanosarcina barkeri CM1]
MKNIMVITSNYPINSSNSYGWFVHEISKRLKNKGFNVVSLAPHYHGSRLKEYLDGVKVLRFPYFVPFSLQKLAYGDGIPYNLKNTLARIQVPLFFLSELVSALISVKKENIDLINSHWLFPQGLVGAICKKVYKVPHIITMHSSEITLLKKVPFSGVFSEFILNNSDFIVSVSRHRIEELLECVSPSVKKKVSAKIKIFPMGVNLNICKYKNLDSLKERYGTKDKFVVLFVGRLVEVKGCEYLIQAFTNLSNKIPNIQLLIVGDGPLETSLKEMVKNLNLQDFIRFEGSVEHQIIVEYYSICDVIVVPSIVDSLGFQEGLPVVLLEALTLGKPIISSRTKGVMEVIQENYNGILVDQKDSKQISSEILKLFENPRMIEKLSKNALESSKEYDWDIIASKYVKLIQEAIL